MGGAAEETTGCWEELKVIMIVCPGQVSVKSMQAGGTYSLPRQRVQSTRWVAASENSGSTSTKGRRI